MHLAAERCSGGLDRCFAALFRDARGHGIVDELEAEPYVEELLNVWGHDTWRGEVGA